DIVDFHAEMVEPADIAVATRDDVQADIAVAEYHRGTGRGAAGGLQPEHRLVELPQHRIVGADHRHMIELREHVESSGTGQTLTETMIFSGKISSGLACRWAMPCS